MLNTVHSQESPLTFLMSCSAWLRNLQNWSLSLAPIDGNEETKTIPKQTTAVNKRKPHTAAMVPNCHQLITISSSSSELSVRWLPWKAATGEVEVREKGLMKKQRIIMTQKKDRAAMWVLLWGGFRVDNSEAEEECSCCWYWLIVSGLLAALLSCNTLNIMTHNSLLSRIKLTERNTSSGEEGWPSSGLSDIDRGEVLLLLLLLPLPVVTNEGDKLLLPTLSSCVCCSRPGGDRQISNVYM